MVALSVVFFSGYNVPLGADIDAEMAFLAEFFINFYEAFQNSIPEKPVLAFSTLDGASYVAHNGKKVKYFQTNYFREKR
jgi:hypothetical protein